MPFTSTVKIEALRVTSSQLARIKSPSYDNMIGCFFWKLWELWWQSQQAEHVSSDIPATEEENKENPSPAPF